MLRSRRGVTIFELLLVLALLGIIATIAFPYMQPTLSKQTLKGDANKLAWTLRSCRQKAITTGKKQMVKILPAGGMYQYEDEWIWLSKGISFVGATTFPDTKAGRVCSFTSQGRPSRSGTAALKDECGHILYVIVNPVGGRVRVSSESPKT